MSSSEGREVGERGEGTRTAYRDGGDGPGGENSNHGPDGDAEPFHDEDAAVEEENGDFNRGQTDCEGEGGDPHALFANVSACEFMWELCGTGGGGGRYGVEGVFGLTRRNALAADIASVEILSTPPFPPATNVLTDIAQLKIWFVSFVSDTGSLLRRTLL